MSLSANNYLVITLSLVLMIGVFIYYQKAHAYEEAPGISINHIANNHY